jgi:hypothetical protein
MRLIGQRWEFRIGNAVVKVDNAYSWSLWGQERMLVNDEEVHSSSGWMRFSQKYQEPWLTPLGEGELRIWLRGGSSSVLCNAFLDEKAVPASAIYSSIWRGPALSWPDEMEWQAQPPGPGWSSQ